MTYNFDPDKWYDNEFNLIETSRKKGEIDAKAFDSAHEQLIDNYEKMLDRLDIQYDYFRK
jgi:hypothetical protein